MGSIVAGAREGYRDRAMSPSPLNWKSRVANLLREFGAYAAIALVVPGGTLIALGQRLRAARLERNDTMAIFSERLGVSERTVRAMEQGLPTVQVGVWLNALWVLDALEPLSRVLEVRESLLDRVRNPRPPRRRASRRRQ